MVFDPAAQVMSMQLFRNGEPYGQPPDNTIQPLSYSAAFGDFRLDALSMTSYSDAGQSPPQFSGSILAHGIVDDVVITWPDPPIADLSGNFDANKWVVNFVGEAGWNYSLERTSDFLNWQSVASAAGNGSMQLVDQNIGSERAFYRVAAERL
jgi:hypothetical protein